MEGPVASQEVAVLVVDDFGAMAADGKTRLRCAPCLCLDSKSDDNCVVRPDGQTYATEGAGMGVGRTPHGVLVYAELETALNNELGTTSFDRRWRGYENWGINWMRKVEEWGGDGPRLLLVAVDTDGFKTSIISDRIQQAIDLFEQGGIHRFVVNMSFAIVPCQSVAWYWQILNSDQDIKTLQDTLDVDVFGRIQGLVTQGTAARTIDPEQLARRLVVGTGYPFREQDSLRSAYDKGFLVGDPLCQWLGSRKDSAGRVVIPVGAAGNCGEDGYQFPFAPAIFDSVVSVGAQREDEAGQAVREGYSNPCEIMMRGDSTALPNEVGTSFAAPRFSAKAAIYLRNGGTDQVPGVHPPLGYATDQGPWDNKTYEQARSMPGISSAGWPA